jgi:hypothetical protein
MPADGLGADHARDKRRLLAAFRDGDPCWRCGQPMRLWQGIDRGHIVSRALGGAQGPAALEHSSCNRSAGSRLGNALRKQAGRPANRGRRHRAPQACVICGATYLPSRAAQVTCGRACGWTLRKRNAGTRTNGTAATMRQQVTDTPAGRQTLSVTTVPPTASRQW